MTSPACFCCIVTKNSCIECFSMLLSLAHQHRDAIVGVLCDTYSRDYIKKSNPDLTNFLQLEFIVGLDEYSDLKRDEMEKKGIWCEFMLSKATIIKHMLLKHNDTMILDGDIIIINKITIDNTKQVGLSPGHIPEKNVKEVGYYNGGYIWFSDVSVVDRWIQISRDSSRYFEQASLEELPKQFSYFEFEDNHNIQSWRVLLDDEKKKLFEVSNNEIMYNNKKVVSIHTHFCWALMAPFNVMIKKFLIECKKTIPLICIDRIESGGKWVIKIPIQPCKVPFFNHKNDTFRELCVLMEEKHDDIKILPYDGVHVWLSRQMNILLYDRPTLEFISGNDPHVRQCSLLLMGNGSKEKEIDILNKNGIITKPWIFWGRRPEILEKYIENNKCKGYRDRKMNTVFIGNIENSIQAKWRDDKKNWKDVIDVFVITSGQKHVMSQEKYLENMANSRFGLSFAGYGCKCNRDVELMALGTVMLRTEGVNIDSYYEPLVEGTHYINVNNKDDVKRIVEEVSEEKWEIMSKACKEWYMRNCYSKNTFNVWMNVMMN
jgi:hypothetical protein